MKKFGALAAALFSYFCIATVMALMAAVAGMWLKGALDPGRLYRVLAALHGIDVVTMQKQLVAHQEEADQEQPSYQARLEQQALKSLDLDLRTTAIDKGLSELQELQSNLEVEQSRFENLKKAYATRLKQLADEEQATSLKEVQRTLEAIKPAQAKEQILKMLDDDAMDDVVTIIKNMAIDKRKKIIAEFKEGPDADALYEILNNIRLGEPTASNIRDAQEKLNEFNQGK